MVATVTRLKAAATTVHYFEADGYYARNDPEHRKASSWYGEAAATLGLHGPGKPKRFESLLAGYVPGTDLRLGRLRDGEYQHRPGVDITFSAPKSVSLEALVYVAPKTRARVVRAHDEAVRATLGFIELELLQTRSYDPQTGRRPRVQADGMAAATFRHLASRNLDPQLHTHAVIANMTRGRDGGADRCVSMLIPCRSRGSHVARHRTASRDAAPWPRSPHRTSGPAHGRAPAPAPRSGEEACSPCGPLHRRLLLRNQRDYVRSPGTAPPRGPGAARKREFRGVRPSSGSISRSLRGGRKVSGGRFILSLNYRPEERKSSAGFHYAEVSASHTVNGKAAQHRAVPVIDARHPVLIALRDADPLAGAVDQCNMVAAAICTVFVQEGHAATSAPWRYVWDASVRYSTQAGESEPASH